MWIDTPEMKYVWIDTPEDTECVWMYSPKLEVCVDGYTGDGVCGWIDT